MSTDWDVYCITCHAAHGFREANHRQAFVLELIDSARAIAAFPEFESWELIEITTPYGPIRTEWFRVHADHDLVARSEYGQILRSARDFPNLCTPWVTQGRGHLTSSTSCQHT